jgi:hypothetical protein
MLSHPREAKLLTVSDAARGAIKLSQAEQIVEKQLKSTENNFDGDATHLNDHELFCSCGYCKSGDGCPR